MNNGLMFQGFEWYLPDNGEYYKDLTLKLDELRDIGITAIWLPPVYKATGTNDTGYGTYDLYDLGEFDQKGSIRTKYGTKEELKNLITEIHNRGMQVYADVVLNHKAAADKAEKFLAVKVESSDRTKNLTGPIEIEGWTGYDFPGRGNTYSDFKWSFNHFSGVDYDNITGSKAIYRIIGQNKGWNLGVSHEKGNFDYLMFADIDHAHPDVKNELKKWAIWFIDELSLDGFRLDAVKHIDQVFLNEFAFHIRTTRNLDFYLLGEYWMNDSSSTNTFLDETAYDIDLFDVSLHYNLYEASLSGGNYDLRRLFDGTIVKEHPTFCVTFVDNHDSQPGQALTSWIEPWFKEIAYGIILLRRDGYPCIFYGDYYGTGGDYSQLGIKDSISKLSKIRKNFAYGTQDDYFNSADVAGWVRHGDDIHPVKCAVIISVGDMKTLKMFVGPEENGKAYADYTGNNDKKIIIDTEGYGEFMVGPGSISVWIKDGLEM